MCQFQNIKKVKRKSQIVCIYSIKSAITFPFTNISDWGSAFTIVWGWGRGWDRVSAIYSFINKYRLFPYLYFKESPITISKPPPPRWGGGDCKGRGVVGGQEA